jgi:hypothetical protein
MSDLLERVRKSKTLASDGSMPKATRLSHGLRALSETNLTAMPRALREPFEANLARINHVLDGYELETFEDYAIIDDADLDRMLTLLVEATGRVIDVELDRIVGALDTAGHKLPVAAIREARQHRDLVVPRLIEVLKHASCEARAGNLPEGQAHFFAIMLLTEFRAHEAFPAIMEAISLPDDLPGHLFEDVITEDLPRILALFVADAPDELDRLIADPNINEYVRWSAARTYLFLVRDGKLSRKDAVRRLQDQLKAAMDRTEEFIVGVLISEMTDFFPQEALADIREAFDRDLVDQSLIRWKHVDKYIAAGEVGMHKALDRCEPTGIDDTIEELRHWAAFSEETSKPSEMPVPQPHFVKPREPLESALAALSSPHRRRVGRNDPCPCGSGKKFKKCCGGGK